MLSVSKMLIATSLVCLSCSGPAAVNEDQAASGNDAVMSTQPVLTDAGTEHQDALTDDVGSIPVADSPGIVRDQAILDVATACARVEFGWIELGADDDGVLALTEGAAAVDDRASEQYQRLAEAILDDPTVVTADAFLDECAGDGFERLQ
jgi:hypothetical protein